MVSVIRGSYVALTSATKKVVVWYSHRTDDLETVLAAEHDPGKEHPVDARRRSRDTMPGWRVEEYADPIQVRIEQAIRLSRAR